MSPLMTVVVTPDRGSWHRKKEFADSFPSRPRPKVLVIKNPMPRKNDGLPKAFFAFFIFLLLACVDLLLVSLV